MPFNGVAVPGLKAARLRRAMTQAQLAEAAKVALSTVARLETDAPGAPGTIRKLADALDVDPSDLMAPEERPTTRVAEGRTRYRTGRRPPA